MGVMRMGKSGRERRTALEEVEGGPVQPKGRGVYSFERMLFDKRRTQSVGNHQHELQRTLACEALMCGIDRHVSFVRAAIMAVELGARGRDARNEIRMTEFEGGTCPDVKNGKDEWQYLASE